MSTEQEHEIVPAIRDWLVSSSDVEIPAGLSREEARRRAHDFLAAIAAGNVAPDLTEVDDDLKDILWASIEVLGEKSLGHPTSEMCDRFYQFVAALSIRNDPFDERAALLHRVARIGWRSAPGGLEAVLKSRAAIWECGDEQRHREICETAKDLAARIDALAGQQIPETSELREVCAHLTKLCNVYPSLVAPSAVRMAALLLRQDRGIGRLDDREHLKATTALAAGMAHRNLGRWDSALSEYAQAAAGFGRTAETSDLDRVDVERLALQSDKGDSACIAEAAQALIGTLVVPRDKIKAQLILAQALINLDRLQDAISILECVRQDPAIENEPGLQAFLFMKLGTALSYVERDADAIASFNAAGAILKRFSHPMQVANLAGAVGEHLGKVRKFNEAAALHLSARAGFQRVGSARFVAYQSVLAAELLVHLGRNEDAEAELIAALPLIERFDLRREAVAAVALLREAVAKRGTDLTAIRQLRDQLRKGLH